MATVIITRDVPARENVREVHQIPRFFDPNSSYVDTSAYDGSVYATNVPGWGELWGLLPLASTPIKLAYLEQAIQAAVEAEAAGELIPSIEVEVTSQMGLLWWQQMIPNLADQGFTFEIETTAPETLPVVGQGQADFAVLAE